MSKKQEIAAILTIIANIGLMVLCAGAPTAALAQPTIDPPPLNEGDAAAVSQAEESAISALLDKEDALQKQEMELQAKEEAMRAKEKELQAKEESWQAKEQELQAQVASVQEKLTAAQEEAAKCAAPPPKKKKASTKKKKPKPRTPPAVASVAKPPPQPAVVTYAPTAQPLPPLPSVAPAPAPAVVVPPGSSYTLNTVYKHQAWIQGADQRTYAVREGDIINGMRIISIDAAERRVQTSHGTIE